MKKEITMLFASGLFFLGSAVSYAQRVSLFSTEQQAKIESLKQEYVSKGVPEDQAESRAKMIVEKENEISLRRTTTPLRTPNPPTSPNSIWIDRDTATVSPGPFHPYHNYSVDSLVMNVFLADPKAKSAITNVTFSGEWSLTARSLAYFSNGDGLGIPNGLILATGDVLGGPTIQGTPEAPNESIGTFSSTGTPANMAGDRHLTPLTNGHQVTNGSCLEFDFKPYTNKATFDFIFASEEYPNYSNSAFNDVFGFFVWEVGGTDTTNIALFPDGTTPVAINNSNWGYNSANTQTALPAPQSGFPPGNNQNSVNPQWHKPIYMGSDLMEFDGRTIKLTAIAPNLDTTKTYHLKLAIANTQDMALGSAVFLANLDLGTPKGSISGDFDPNGGRGWKSVWDDEALLRGDFYSGCNQALSFDVKPKNRDRYMHFKFSPEAMRDFTIVGDSIFPDSVFVAKNRNTPINIPFSVREISESLSGVPVSVYSWFTNATGTTPVIEYDTTTFTIYDHPTNDIRYIRQTIGYQGLLDLNIKGGTPYLRVSIDNGDHWQLASSPFTASQLEYLKEAEVFVVWLKEPNSCWSQKINVGSNIVIPNITRPILMPDVAGATLSMPMGIHYVNSGNDFSFGITPTGANAGKVPVVETGRKDMPKGGDVNVKDNGNGTFTVTIYKVQTALELNIFFINSNSNTVVGQEAVWSSNGMLYISASAAGKAQVYNVSGAAIRTIAFSVGQTGFSLPQGVYVVTLDNGNTYKVVVK
ncbi:choice-of-anchor L domain-containing protein [Tannerella sp.]|uniref:choice-of-anchor L domain-containing protein n=1 Tax=Tannerella sp. TaxID=2382127 RepID=UPI0026DC1A1D|nr:choice-of-anchor L domain-containing protein [Tannerella sp.]MDO4702950.1 choice-of-anchor L domain-containing protein [Tannerella sp.]